MINFSDIKHMFVLKQISPSRKEVRLILNSVDLNVFPNGPDLKFQDKFKELLGSVAHNTHTYNYIL